MIKERRNGGISSQINDYYIVIIYIKGEINFGKITDEIRSN